MSRWLASISATSATLTLGGQREKQETPACRQAPKPPDQRLSAAWVVFDSPEGGEQVARRQMEALPAPAAMHEYDPPVVQRKGPWGRRHLRLDLRRPGQPRLR